MIRLSNVHKSYNNEQSYVVKNVNFVVDPGEILVLLGSSGSGKTTVLKMINRLIEPSSGTIEIDGIDTALQDPVQLRRQIGYVFQGVGLFPHMTVFENIAIILRLIGKSKSYQWQRACELLELIGLKPDTYAKRYPSELSGGQRQRVGVARALADNPDYLLMDEPFGALDAITRDELQEELLRLNQDLHKTIIFVTHDLFEALRLGDRIAIMHQGKIEQLGTKQEILKNPKTEFVRDLFAKPASQLKYFLE